MVGNKKDLRNDQQTIRELAKMKQEPVRPEQGRAIAEQIGAFAYLECSAKAKDVGFIEFEKCSLQRRNNGRALNRYLIIIHSQYEIYSHLKFFSKNPSIARK